MYLHVTFDDLYIPKLLEYSSHYDCMYSYGTGVPEPLGGVSYNSYARIFEKVYKKPLVVLNCKLDLFNDVGDFYLQKSNLRLCIAYGWDYSVQGEKEILIPQSYKRLPGVLGNVEDQILVRISHKTIKNMEDKAAEITWENISKENYEYIDPCVPEVFNELTEEDKIFLKGRK